MATKRQAPDDSNPKSANTAPSRKRFKPNPGSFRAQTDLKLGPKSFKKAHPTNHIKSNIRSLKRLLENRESLPANVRVEKERALQTAEQELKDAEKAKKRSEMIGRYHKARFFDRQKADRRLKKARKELRAFEGEDQEERRALGRKVDDAEVDLNYALYFPYEVRYVSLFGRAKDGTEEGGVGDGERRGDPQMWELVKKCMAKSKRELELLREGRLKDEEEVVVDEVVERKAARKEKKSAKKEKVGKVDTTKSSTTNTAEQEEEDDGSSSDDNGGGFFE
ncbi:unnamed protein product [Zymoseptoria tritici ST99CH_3D7]|uniref:rRNA-processing protein EFG1 n=1 Tax=Zymoseptoria tritici (strain ST99CH_3D7) TaxID=1276538 RepID=A0A1X7REN1_ZYMT9|nr:unnamed protein product [Zymoseptoria tritici ST99CH_3D7]